MSDERLDKIAMGICFTCLAAVLFFDFIGCPPDWWFSEFVLCLGIFCLLVLGIYEHWTLRRESVSELKMKIELLRAEIDRLHTVLGAVPDV